MCIIAYGQTGAGKTYTMMGTRENPGVNLRSATDYYYSFLKSILKFHSVEMGIIVESLINIASACPYL